MIPTARSTGDGPSAVVAGRDVAIERAVVEAVAGFWAGVLVWPSGVVPADQPPDGSSGEVVVAVVGIGGYPGRIVRVTCSEPLAVAASQRAFGTGSTVEPADVDDTVKELANVVAGAVKAVADGATTMTLPMCARRFVERWQGSLDDLVHEGCWRAATGDWLVVEVVARSAQGGRS